jgi:hypothetical protein
MQLPFTVEQFNAVFVWYNTELWPAQVMLNLLGVAAIALCFASRPPSRAIAASIGVLWLWTGLVYHVLFFSEINPVAKVFGALCAVQGLLFFYFGVFKKAIDFRFERRWEHYTGAALLLYAMLLYPLLGHLLGHRYPGSPTFGAPCPTTIFTFGLLLWTRRNVNRVLLVIPFIWSLIGFTAAVKLGIGEDIGLLIAGVAGTAIAGIGKKPLEKETAK